MSSVTGKQELGDKEFVTMMAALMSVVAITIDAMLPALGIMSEDLGATHPNQIQFIVACVFAGMATGQLVFGPLSDAIGRKKVLNISFSIYLFGSTMCIFSQTMEFMLVGRFLQGIGVAGPYVSSISIIRDKYSGRSMARIMSLVMMVFITVPTFAPAIGQALMFAGSWRYIFVLFVVYAVVVLLWITFRFNETLRPENRIPYTFQNLKHGLAIVFGNRITIGYLLCAGCIFGGFLGYLTTCQQVFQVQFGVAEMFVVYFGCLALTLGAASLLNSYFVEKLGMRYICFRSLCVVIAVSLLFLLVHAITDIRLWMYMTYASVLFFCFGLLLGNINALAMEPMGHNAGIASAIIGAGSTTISMTLGTIIGQSYDGTLIPIVSGFLFLGILALAIMHMTEKGRPAYTPV